MYDRGGSASDPRNAIIFPSGRGEGLEIEPAMDAMVSTGPPSAATAWSVERSTRCDGSASRVDRNKSFLPSGDQTGSEASNGPEVSRFGIAGRSSESTGGAATVQICAGCFGSRYPALSVRNSERVTTRTSDSRGGTTPLALLAALSRSSGVVPLKKAIDLPSGDQTGADTPSGRSVKLRGSPPLIVKTNIWAGRALPSTSTLLTNSNRAPSGDHRGETSRGPTVNRRGSPPPVETTQIDDS